MDNKILVYWQTWTVIRRITCQVPVVIKSFRPVMAKITRLHLCEFWPTREISALELKG